MSLHSAHKFEPNGKCGGIITLSTKLIKLNILFNSLSYPAPRNYKSPYLPGHGCGHTYALPIVGV